jgi:tripartite-type tricarboxylate transporter receptor subunit TctC
MLKRMLAVAALAAAIVAPSLAAADDYPVRPIKLVNPFPAGGPADIIARTIGQRMQEIIGQPIVVESHSGAAGVTGVDYVAKATPDGYTIGISSPGALAINPSVQTNMPYNVQKDLAPISLIVRVPEILVVGSAVPAKTLPDFIALAKQKNGAMNFASTGPGGMPHLAAALLLLKAGIKAQHVPYKGAAPAVNDLLGNQVDFMFADIPILLPHVKAGTFTALAIGSTQRSPQLPDLKTTAEQGYPDVLADNWYGMIAPAATPQAIIAKLNTAVNQALKDEGVIAKLQLQGITAVGSTPQELADTIAAETKKWGDVIQQAGIKLDE